MNGSLDRFWSKVDKTETCWLWSGAASSHGYGQFFLDGKIVAAHRYSYELYVGPIPDGLTIDHLCRVRHCVNPAHLEPVTQRENTLRSPVSLSAINARKTHCKRGHEFTPENTQVISGRGNRPWRACLACRYARERSGRNTRRAA